MLRCCATRHPCLPWLPSNEQIGVRTLCVVGALLAIPGVAGLSRVTPDTNYWLIAFALFVAGVSFGANRGARAATRRRSGDEGEGGGAASLICTYARGWHPCTHTRACSLLVCALSARRRVAPSSIPHPSLL